MRKLRKIKRKLNFSLKYNIKVIVAFIIGIILSGTGVYAATIYFEGSNVGYDNTSSGFVDSNGNPVEDVQTALDELYKKVTTFKVGDYVVMTPTATSFTTDPDKTGYSEAQTISTSSSLLWVVIKVNSDGTAEMVEYSGIPYSNKVYFKGVKGYQNLVGYLNELANYYQNSNYTIAARNIGYDNQTEYISDTSAFDGTNTAPPWNCGSQDLRCPIYGTRETLGGGDDQCRKDLGLVESVVGSLGTLDRTSYWVSCRTYELAKNGIDYDFYGAYVGDSYSGSPYFAYGSYLREYSGSGSSSNFYDYARDYTVRPIVTLKAGVKPSSGFGKSSWPYILE